MRLLRILVLRLRSLVRPGRVDAELDAELRFHVERQIDLHVEAGLSREAARTEALRDVGAIGRWEEECRDQRGLRRIGTLVRDLRQTWRSVRSRPGASLAVVLVLALGLGLTSAMFALADPFVLRPLPYPHPEELVVIHLGQDLPQVLTRDAELPSVEGWRRRQDLFQGLTTFQRMRTRLRLPEGAVELTLAQVTPDTLDLLGIYGTGFSQWPSDSARGETMLALTGEGRAALPAADIGSALHSQDGRVLRIGAILPGTFRFPTLRGIHAFVPVNPAPPVLEVRQWRSDGRPANLTTHSVFARLHSSITPEAVEKSLTTPLPSGRPLEVDVTPLAEHLTSDVRPVAWGALAAGLLILGLCMANVANLLLARGAFRTREFATRQALGASRLDLAQLLLVELAVVVGFGVACGLALTHFVLGGIAFIVPEQYTALGTPEVTLRVVGLAALAGGSIVLVGIVPSVLVWRLAARARIAQVATSESRGIRLVRFLMAAGQSAVAIILVIGAALLVRSFVNLATQDTGFASDAIVASVSYASEQSGVELQRTLGETIERLRRVPGVSAVGAAAGAMVDGRMSGTVFSVEGRPAPMDLKYVSPGYFDAVGTTFRAGRTLTEPDGVAGTIVVNEAMVARHWPGGSAVGNTLVWGQRTMTVVGVVTNSLDRALDRAPGPMVFTLFAGPRPFSPINYVVRADAQIAEPLLRRAITEINRDAVIVDVSTLGDRLLGSVRSRVFATIVLGLFALAGVSVCAAGLGGIVSFLVARRTREIAIRTAIGAEAHHVRRLVMRQALAASAVGLAAGLAIGRWLSRSLESLLYGVQAGDRLTFVLGATLLIAIVVVATWVPATRALRISPTTALKVD